MQGFYSTRSVLLHLGPVHAGCVPAECYPNDRVDLQSSSLTAALQKHCQQEREKLAAAAARRPIWWDGVDPLTPDEFLISSSSSSEDHLQVSDGVACDLAPRAYRLRPYPLIPGWQQLALSVPPQLLIVRMQNEPPCCVAARAAAAALCWPSAEAMPPDGAPCVQGVGVGAERGGELGRELSSLDDLSRHLHMALTFAGARPDGAAPLVTPSLACSARDKHRACSLQPRDVH